MSEYTFKTYRVEWAAEVYTVDQYGNEFSPSEILYYKGFPTRDEAVEHLEEISYPHKYVQGRRVCKDKKSFLMNIMKSRSDITKSWLQQKL